MAEIVIPGKGRLLELTVNEEGVLKDNGVLHIPRNYSILGTANFQHTIRLNKKTLSHPDIKKEYYSRLKSFVSEHGADLFQIVKEKSYMEPENWGVSYETLILMYVK